MASGNITRTPDYTLTSTEDITNAKINRVGGGTYRLDEGAVTDRELSVSLTGGFANVAALRASTDTFIDGDEIKVKGYYTEADDDFGPSLYYDSSDTTTADDGFTCIMDGNGARYKRSFSSPINITWAGAKGDYDENATSDDNTDDTFTDNSAAIQTVINYLILRDGGKIEIPSGQFGLSSALEVKYRHHKDSDSSGYRRFCGIRFSGNHATNNDSIFENLPGCCLVASKANTTGIFELTSIKDVIIEDIGLINKADAAPSMINVTSYSKGEPDGNYITDAAITASDSTLTSPSNGLGTAEVGEVIRVAGAGAAAADLVTTVSSVTSAGEIELAATASTTVSGAVAYWPEPVPTSTTHLTFSNIIFQDDETVTSAVVDLQNCKFTRFEKCSWLTGSKAIEIGEDPASEPYPLMNGDVSNLTFTECFFAGDTYYKQGRVVSWINCEWWPVKDGSGEAARIVPAGNELLRGATLINCKALFDGDGTGTFFEWGAEASNLTVLGGGFGDYNRAFVLDSAVAGSAIFEGVLFDNDGSGDRDVEITSNYQGSVYINGEHSSTINAGRQAITDGRSTDKDSLRYQLALHRELASTYTLTGGASYETVLSGATRARGGFYRVTLACNIASLHTSIYRMRLKNYNQTQVEQYIPSGGNSTLFWTGIIRLPAPTPTTSTVAGTVTSVGTALTGSGTNFNPELTVGDWVEVTGTGDRAQVASVTDDTNAVLEEAFYYGDVSGVSVQSVNAPTFLEMEVRQINAGSTSTVTVAGSNAGNTFMMIEEI